MLENYLRKKLNDYMFRHDLKSKEMAEQLKVTPSLFSKIMCGERKMQRYFIRRALELINIYDEHQSTDEKIDLILKMLIDLSEKK